jgi:Uma2 family endonuclease
MLKKGTGMATATNLMTWAAFEGLPSGDGLHREIIEGELQTLPPPKSLHSLVARAIFKILLGLEAQAKGRALVEAGYKLSNDPPTWVQPDASFLSNARVQSTAQKEYFEGAPELAVEIVSPSESARDLNKKVRLLLQAGCLAVWVIYAEEQLVVIHRPDGTSATVKPGDTLTAAYLADGWSVPVAELFGQ